MTELFAPVCSITTTKRRRFFWAAWWTGPPVQKPFKKPDASDGGSGTIEEALAAAENRAGTSLTRIDPLWARAWIRILRGEEAWPSKASREPRVRTVSAAAPNASVWSILGVTREVTEEELKAAFRQKALATHPDQGGDQASFQAVLRAYEEAQRRLKKPRPR